VAARVGFKPVTFRAEDHHTPKAIVLWQIISILIMQIIFILIMQIIFILIMQIIFILIKQIIFLLITFCPRSLRGGQSGIQTSDLPRWRPPHP